QLVAESNERRCEAQAPSVVATPCSGSAFARPSKLSTLSVDGARVERCGGSPPGWGEGRHSMARKVIGPTGSRRRRWLFLCTTVAAIATAVLFIPSAFAVHDMGIFQLDGDAQTTLQSPVPAAEDWDLICKANKVQIGT